MERWFPIGFLVLFPVLWCSVSTMLGHIGGWSALAEHYRTAERPRGKAFFMQSGRVGIVNYGSCLTIHVNEAGMFLAVLSLFRLGHPPLFIPWSEFNNCRETKMMFFRFIEASIGTPPIARLRLRPGILPIEALESWTPPSR